jgi:excisionase family DNA binding protein
LSLFAGSIGQRLYNQAALFRSMTASLRMGKNLLLMQERWLSVGEIAAHLGVNPDTIYKWITRKKMPAHKLGRLWKFLASEVDQWVKGGHAAEDVATESTVGAAGQKRRRRKAHPSTNPEDSPH